MIEVFRIIQDQTNLYSYRATQKEDRAAQLEALIESTKPIDAYADWHPLISTAFRYSPPLRNARFRPPFGKNVFYASLFEETALYEHAFHFMKQRRHLPIETDADTRTIFLVDAHDKDTIHIQDDENAIAIMDKNDYSSSHQFIEKNKEAHFILYPSCRDPQQRDNAAILDIHHLEKKPGWEKGIKYFYNNKINQILWIDYELRISWGEVS